MTSRDRLTFSDFSFTTQSVGLQYIYDTVMKKETEGKREENKG